jgi:hypothetical protein
MQTITEKDFEDAIKIGWGNNGKVFFESLAAEACYDLALKMAEQAFNAARESGVFSFHLAQTTCKYPFFQDYQSSLKITHHGY